MSIPAAKSTLAAVSHKPPAESNDNAVFDLACELYELLAQVLTASGMTKEDQRRAALEDRKVTSWENDRPSIRVMHKYRGIGTILATWKNDKRFLDENGNPVVLPIRGSGRTLESIARFLDITVSMDEIVQTLCEWGDVSRLAGERVVLMGTSVVIYKDNPTVVLGTITTHMRRMVETALFNSEIPRERRAEGLFQRAITGTICKSKFAAFAEEVRPRLQQICDELEERIYATESKNITNEADDVCGFEIFLFREGYKAPSLKRRPPKSRYR